MADVWLAGESDQRRQDVIPDGVSLVTFVRRGAGVATIASELAGARHGGAVAIRKIPTIVRRAIAVAIDATNARSMGPGKLL